jgi:uncharacterized integral membrane protein
MHTGFVPEGSIVDSMRVVVVAEIVVVGCLVVVVVVVVVVEESRRDDEIPVPGRVVVALVVTWIISMVVGVFCTVVLQSAYMMALYEQVSYHPSKMFRAFMQAMPQFWQWEYLMSVLLQE